MRSKSDVENRHLLKYAGYPDMQENSLRMTDNFALRPEYAREGLDQDVQPFIRVEGADIPDHDLVLQDQPAAS
jgi:hypothetical protein